MPSCFDRDLWRHRTIQRFNKAVDAQRSGAGAQLHCDLSAVDGLESVVGWCSTKGLDVTFVRMKTGGLYEDGDHKITVSGHLRPEKQLHVLLHECGHHLIAQTSRDTRFSHGYPAEDPGTLRSDLHRVDVLDEELEAWARGLKLAKRLKITLDVERYNRSRTEYVKTYLRWAARADNPRRKRF